MIDQLIIGDIASNDEYEASVASRAIHAPTKKSIKETVPFSNLTYDFSAINGEVYWNERALEYVFEIVADTPESLEEKKKAFLSWIMNVTNEKLIDPYIPDYHFLATFEDIKIDDSEVEKSTIAVTFSAYPYMIANEKTRYTFSLSAGEEVTAKITNGSSHRITPTLICDVPVTVAKGNMTYSMGAGEVTDEKIMLAVGVNELKIKASTAGTFKVEFYEEVF